MIVQVYICDKCGTQSPSDPAAAAVKAKAQRERAREAQARLARRGGIRGMAPDVDGANVVALRSPEGDYYGMVDEAAAELPDELDPDDAENWGHIMVRAGGNPFHTRREDRAQHLCPTCFRAAIMRLEASQ